MELAAYDPEILRNAAGVAPDAAQRGTRREGRPVFNRTNENIDWAWWSWNPVTGCLHDCKYCYARGIAARFGGSTGFRPTFHPERLDATVYTRVPKSESPWSRCVFVCSMADLFGDWVPQEWIDAVLERVRAAPQWTFIFLTKNPKRLPTIAWPGNAWVGATVDVQARVQATEEAFSALRAPVRFVSCEPLQEPVVFTRPELLDWIIIGARSMGKRKVQPQWGWVESLTAQANGVGAGVYMKPNLAVEPHLAARMTQLPRNVSAEVLRRGRAQA